MIALPQFAGDDAALWDALFDVADRVPEGWTLVGGQMVLLHALERGRMPPRVSVDLDLIADVRLRQSALLDMAGVLEDLGFTPEIAIVDGIAQRFVRGRAVVDLLAPDGLGPRTDPGTVPPGRTVQIAGGTFALGRSAPVAVEFAGRAIAVPRPDLLGALVVKSCAARHDSRPERHLRDLAFLYSLVSDPLGLRDELSARNRARLAAVVELSEPASEFWDTAGDLSARRAGHAAFRLMGAAPARPR